MNDPYSSSSNTIETVYDTKQNILRISICQFSWITSKESFY